ncbi:MAG: hypothetical protein HYU69_00335 [Bacteroidetes bacterium]|nr:hypothetical protein [Bacteroidota bacterium]
MKTLTVDEIEVPVDVIVEVSNLLNEHGITNELRGGNEEEETVTIQIQYDRKDVDEKEAVMQIEEMISDYHGYDDEKENEED